MKEALKSLRRKSMAASRTGGSDRSLLISIGMAEPEEEPEEGAEGEEDEEEDEAEKLRRKR